MSGNHCSLCSQELAVSSVVSAGGSGSGSSSGRKKNMKSEPNVKPSSKTNSTTVKKKQGGSSITPILESGVTNDGNGILWHKTGVPGNAGLDIFLADGQEIIADKHAMVFMDADIKYRVEMGGLKKAIARKLGGESAFLSYYTGTKPGGVQRLTLGMPIIGDVKVIQLQKDEKIVVSKGCFLAGTNNLKVSGAFNPKGILPFGTQEGAFLTLITSENGPSTLWVNSYGNIEEHNLKAGESIIVDNEHFLSCMYGIDFSIVRLGNTKALFFGGEGLAMKFTGPCKIMTQSKGLMSLCKTLAPILSMYMNTNNKAAFDIGF